MNFKQWLRKTFGPRVQTARSSRRGKSRQPSRYRWVPTVESLEVRLVPTTLIVNSLGNSGTGSLRDAINASVSHTTDGLGQTGTGNDTIQFSSAIDGGTISLSSFTNDTTVAGASAFLIGNHDTLVIDGETGLTQGITITRGGTTPFRIFDVNATGNLTLKGLTITGGKAQGSAGGGSAFSAPGGGSAGMGGAIFNQGKLTLLDSTLTGNTALGGAAGPVDVYGFDLSSTGSGGGGLGAAGSAGGSFQINGGIGGGPNGGTGAVFHTAAGNGGFGGGGGGGNGYEPGGAGGFGAGGGGGGTVTINDGDSSTTFGANGGHGGFGGGGGAPGSSYNLVGRGGFGGGDGRSYLTGFWAGGGAGMGGAIFNEAGSVVITNSTVTGNTASGGAGSGNHGYAGQGLGGGLFTYNGTITVSNSTFSLNAADQGGRGIYVLGDGGIQAKATINNTIIGQSDTNVSDLALNTTPTGSATALGQANLIRTTTVFGLPQNILGALTTDPQLGPLQHNGGPTQTMAVPTSSPAFDAGSNAAVPAGVATDQRGFPRIYRGTVDIGAYELRFPADNMVVNTLNDGINTGDGTLTLSEALGLANGTIDPATLSAAERNQVTPVAGAVSTITFASSLNGKTITLTQPVDASAGTSEFLIDSAVVIDGPSGNSGITLAPASGGIKMRLFHVASTGNLTLNNLTLSGGYALGSYPGYGGSSGGSGQGGAIYNQGSLTITDSTLTGNTAQGGHGGPALAAAGGAGGNGMGGAIFNEEGTVVINNSTFYDNTARGGLGGHGTVVNGSPGKGLGGGLYNDNGVITVSDSTFSGNTVIQGNGSTLIAAGRGIYNVGAPLSAAINSTIIAQADTAIEDFTGIGVNNAFGNSDLIRTSSGLIFNGSVITGDPLLGPLQSNGGPTRTMALVASSPAIGQGFVFNGDYTDQRGVPRPVFKVDIGAYQRATLDIVVNTAVDETTDDSTLSLREAIDLVNGTLSPNELSGAEMHQVSAAVSGGPDTITFDSSLDGMTITLSTVGDTSFGPSAFLVASAIDIEGPSGDSGVTLSAAGTTMRLFDVTGNLTLQNLTLSGGTARGSAGSGAGNGSVGLGGAIYNLGSLTILDDTFTGSTSQGGAGGTGGASGGAGEGGAIFNEAGTVAITNSTFTGNTASGGAPRAGGTAGQGLGGALFSHNGLIQLNSSTISGNTAADGGRGIFTLGGNGTIYYSIIGQSDTSVSDVAATGGGSLHGVFDLIRTRSGFSSFSAVITGDPLLGPLQENGGPTQTMALSPGSPAIGVAKLPPDNNRPTTDQRGAYRLLPSDLGAYEVRPAFKMIVNTLDDDAADIDQTTLSLHEAIDLANGTLPFSDLSPADQRQVTPAAGIVNTITFAGSLNFSTPLTLSTVGFLSVGATSLQVNTQSVGPTAFLVNSRLVIDGPSGASGLTLAVASGVKMRLFDVTPSGNLTLQNLTLSGGAASGFAGGNGYLGGEGGGSAGLGGAIFNQGTLTILDSTLTGNTAQGGAGGSGDSTIHDNGGGGGGGLNENGNTPGSADPSLAGYGGGPNRGSPGLNFDHRPQFVNGENGGFGGGGGGGGVYPGGGASGYGLAVGSGGMGGFGAGGGGSGYAHASIKSQGGAGGFGGGGGGSGLGGLASAGGYGGGAGLEGGGGGGAGLGGAVFNEGGTVVITNSTFTGNKALGGAGGGDADAGMGLGGGLFNYNGAITVTNSTFSGNTAKGGRGIVVLADGANTTASAEIDNTIVGQSDTAVSDLVIQRINNGFAYVVGGTNLIRTAKGANNGLTVTLTDDPRLDGLASNGGPTQTMALASNSPAIDAGTAAGAPTTDQRGLSRARAVDIGAFEFQPQPQIITFSSLTAVTYGDADFALSATASSGLAVTFTDNGNASVFEIANVWFVHITGAGSATITAHQAGNADFDSAADVDQLLAINKANAVIVVTPYTVAYDGQAHRAAGTATGVIGVDLSGGLALSGTTHSNAGTFTDGWSFHDAAGNYADQSGTVTDSIGQASAVIVITPYTSASTTYDGNTHTATGTATGNGGINLSSDLTLTGATHINAGTYIDTWTFHDPTGNYHDASGTITDSIAQASAALVVTPYTVTYSGVAHTATGAATGVNNVDLSADFSLGGTTHTNVGTYADSWSFHDVAGNYRDANGTVTDSIVPALGATALLEGPASGGDADLVITSGNWMAASNASWLHTGSAGAGDGLATFSFDANPGATRTGTLTIAGLTVNVTQAGSTYVAANPLTPLASTGLSLPGGVAVDAAGNVYIADFNHNALKEWNASTQQVTTLVSSGLNHPIAVAVDGSGNVYIADRDNNAIKEWHAATQQVTTLVSSGLNEPVGVAADGAGNVYIADYGNLAIKEWNARTQQVKTVVTGQFLPSGVAVDPAGNVYIADSLNNLVELWNPTTQQLSFLVAFANNPSGLKDPAGLGAGWAPAISISPMPAITPSMCGTPGPTRSRLWSTPD